MTQGQALPRIVRKCEYARHRGCHPSMVTKLIRQAKLGPPALLPDGRIDPVLADQQLAARLDPARVRKTPRSSPLEAPLQKPTRRKVERLPKQAPDEQVADFTAYQTSRARREQASAALAEAKLAKVRGDLIEAQAAHEMAKELGLLTAETLDARRMELAHRIVGIANVSDALAILVAADRQWRLDLARAIDLRVEAVCNRTGADRDP